MIHLLSALAVILVIPSGLVSCSTYGHIPPKQQRDAIQPGMTTEDTALKLLGKPGRTDKDSLRRRHGWTQLQLETGFVRVSQFQILVDQSGLVLNKNDHEGQIAKTGRVITTTTNPSAFRSPSLDILAPGMSGRECERILGNPISRELLISGEIERVWIDQVSNVYLLTNQKPTQYIVTFDANDRLTKAQTKH